MDRGKSKHKGSQPTQNTEPEYRDVNSESDSFTSIGDAIPNLNFPLPGNSMLQPYSQEMLFPDIDVMTDIGPRFDGSQILDYSPLYGPLFQNSNRNPTESHQFSTQNDERNSFRSSNVNAVQNNQIDRSYNTVFGSPSGIELTGSSTHHVSSTLAREIDINTTCMNNAVPSSYPRTLDGNSSSLGNIAARPNLNFYSRDTSQSHQTDWNAHFNMASSYNHQNLNGNLLGPMTNMAHGSVHNVGGNRASGLPQWPSCNNFQAVSSTNNNMLLNSRLSHVSPMQQFDMHLGSSRPSIDNSGVVENFFVPLSNSGPSRGFQSYRPTSSATFSASQVRTSTPNAGQLRFQQRPLYYPFMTAGNTTQSISGQPQVQHARPVVNLNSEPTTVSPFGVCNIKPGRSDQFMPTTQGSSAPVTRQFFNIGVQPAGNLNQPQAIVQGLQASSKALLAPIGPPTQAENNSVAAAAQASGRISCKRGAMSQSTTVVPPQVQQRMVRARIPNTASLRQFVQQTRPTSVRPLAQNIRPPAALRSSLPPLARMDSVVHIKRPAPDASRPSSEPEPIDAKCFLCKRNVRYAPKGPYVKPTNPLPVAVLPCGHVFHDECLEDITPKTEAKNPPCIPCAMAGINN